MIRKWAWEMVRHSKGHRLSGVTASQGSRTRSLRPCDLATLRPADSFCFSAPIGSLIAQGYFYPQPMYRLTRGSLNPLFAVCKN